MIHFLMAMTAIQFMQGCGIFLIAFWVSFFGLCTITHLLNGLTKESVFKCIRDTVTMFGIILLFIVPIGLVVDFFMFLGVF